ncbi:MAG: methyltransferase domain-containing protein [Pusillimonas sp.]
MPSSSAEDAVTEPLRTPVNRPDSWKEKLIFARAFLRNPTGIGAIMPSGYALACAITSGLVPGTGKVLELGTGTGVFTQHMLAMGFDPADLVLVEQNASLADNLRTRFPRSTVLQVSAQALARQDDFVLSDVAATVCGLPLRNMRDHEHRQMLEATFKAMRPDGNLYLFTYGLKCPVARTTLDALQLVSVLKKVVIKNVPPAAVYCISRVSG